MSVEFCYIRRPLTGKTVIVKRGEQGFFELTNGYEDMDPDILNANLGITKEQAEAMLIGSLFNWNAPGAITINKK